jgi:hypothetical protein
VKTIRRATRKQYSAEEKNQAAKTRLTSKIKKAA